jgi:hypothetical protein
MIKLCPATAKHVEAVAANLRHSDDLECRYAYGISGAEALREAVRESHIVHSICAENDEALGVCGLNGSIVWLLATDALTATPERRRALALQGRRWIDKLLADKEEAGHYPMVENWVFAANVESLEWLRAMGFHIETAQPIGPSKQLFSNAWRSL